MSCIDRFSLCYRNGVSSSMRTWDGFTRGTVLCFCGKILINLINTVRPFPNTSHQSNDYIDVISEKFPHLNKLYVLDAQCMHVICG